MRYESNLDVEVEDIGTVADYLHDEYGFRRPDVGEQRAYVPANDEEVRIIIDEDGVDVYHDEPIDDVDVDALESAFEQIVEYGEASIDIDTVFESGAVDVPDMWHDAEDQVSEETLYDSKYNITREPTWE